MPDVSPLASIALIKKEKTDERPNVSFALSHWVLMIVPRPYQRPGAFKEIIGRLKLIFFGEFSACDCWGEGGGPASDSAFSMKATFVALTTNLR